MRVFLSPRARVGALPWPNRISLIYFSPLLFSWAYSRVVIREVSRLGRCCWVDSFVHEPVVYIYIYIYNIFTNHRHNITYNHIVVLCPVGWTLQEPVGCRLKLLLPGSLGQEATFQFPRVCMLATTTLLRTVFRTSSIIIIVGKSKNLSWSHDNATGYIFIFQYQSSKS